MDMTRVEVLTNAVLPAKMRNMRKTIIRYAFWKGTIDWSSNDMPVFV